MDMRTVYQKKVTKLPLSHVSVVNGCYDSPKSRKKSIKYETESLTLPIEDKQRTQQCIQSFKFDAQELNGMSNNKFKRTIFSSHQSLLAQKREQICFLKTLNQNTQVCF